jgi:hypothetical protein
VMAITEFGRVPRSTTGQPDSSDQTFGLLLLRSGHHHLRMGDDDLGNAAVREA